VYPVGPFPPRLVLSFAMKSQPNVRGFLRPKCFYERNSCGTKYPLDTQSHASFYFSHLLDRLNCAPYRTPNWVVSPPMIQLRESARSPTQFLMICPQLLHSLHSLKRLWPLVSLVPCFGGIRWRQTISTPSPLVAHFPRLSFVKTSPFRAGAFKQRAAEIFSFLSPEMATFQDTRGVNSTPPSGLEHDPMARSLLSFKCQTGSYDAFLVAPVRFCPPLSSSCVGARRPSPLSRRP